LVGACIFAVLHLNHLHLNVAKGLSENVQSTFVASLLETNTTRLVGLLRGDHSQPGELAKQVEILNQEARRLLDEASDLANLDKEKDLVPKIRAGLTEYFDRWANASAEPELGSTAERDAQLANLLEQNVLAPCKELRNFNTDQFRQSDTDNLTIVQELQWSFLAIGIGGPLGGLILGYAVARSLSHSIYQLSVRIRDAAGRLNRELGSVTLEEQGDLPDLHRQMQGVTEEIERVVGQLQQREREVLRAEQLAAVGQVAAGVAHELRNPLTSVKMLVQTSLEDDASSGLAREDLTVIEHEIRRMEQCIRVFLDFARPPDSERRRADFREVLSRALALIEGRARRQKVHLAVHVPNEALLVKIDPEQVHQVVVNLLLNALDALPHGGTIFVDVEGKASSDEQLMPNGSAFSSRGEVAVRIRDTGAGIAPRIAERLFEPFVSSKETGLGLGLTICKRLIEAHGGTIEGANAREGGAMFTFSLPLEETSRLPLEGVKG
jgi:signal transduction histidine kinase